jgi:hypothetical protein
VLSMPYDIAQFGARWVPYAYQQATNRRGEVVAARPTSARARCCTAGRAG